MAGHLSNPESQLTLDMSSPQDLENQHHTNCNLANGPPTAYSANGSITEDTRRPPWRLGVVIEDFSFLWFTVSMDTGILSIVLHQLPYRFHGLRTLSSILFISNIVLFTIFFTVLVLRIILYPKAVIRSLSTDVTQLAATGAVVIAWFTICAQISLSVSTTPWGAHAFFLVAIVFWWIGTFVALAITLGVLFMVSEYDITNTKSITPAIVFPCIATITDGLIGAIICTYSHYVNAPLAVPVIVVGYLLTGLGFSLALILYAIYFVRLINHGLPPVPQLPSLVLLVGPCGQTGAAIQVLGSAAKHNFGRYNRGTFLTSSGASFLSLFGTVIGLLVTGLGTLIALFALYALAEACVRPSKRRQMHYSMFWWSTVFPLATLNTSLIELSISLDSAAFRGLSAALFLVLIVDFFVNWGFTLKGILTGKLLSGRKWREGEEREKGQ